MHMSTSVGIIALDLLIAIAIDTRIIRTIHLFLIPPVVKVAVFSICLLETFFSTWILMSRSTNCPLLVVNARNLSCVLSSLSCTTLGCAVCWSMISKHSPATVVRDMIALTYTVWVVHHNGISAYIGCKWAGGIFPYIWVMSVDLALEGSAHSLLGIGFATFLYACTQGGSGYMVHVRKAQTQSAALIPFYFADFCKKKVITTQQVEYPKNPNNYFYTTISNIPSSPFITYAILSCRR